LAGDLRTLAGKPQRPPILWRDLSVTRDRNMFHTCLESFFFALLSIRRRLTQQTPKHIAIPRACQLVFDFACVKENYLDE
jgi:hypothetical protein